MRKRKKKRRQVWKNATRDEIKDVAKQDNKDEYVGSNGYHPIWCGPEV